MKKLIIPPMVVIQLWIVILVTSCLVKIQAQQFGHLGTAWEHCLTPGMEPNFLSISVNSGESISINGIDCFVLRSSDFINFGSAIVDSVVVCSIGDRVYYQERDSLYLLYDFSLQMGEEYQLKFPVELDQYYEIFFPDESLYWDIHIDSVATLQLDGVMVRRQYISYLTEERESLIYLGSWATERIGYETWIFPFLSFGEYNPHCELTEFVDEQIQIVDTTNSCITSSLHPVRTNQMSPITVFPNPCTNLLKIRTNDCRFDAITITDLQGRSYRNLHFADAEIDVSFLPSGLYFLEFVLENKIVVLTFIKSE